MKLVFVSNFFNHHQQPFSEKMYELTGGNYRFVSTTEIPDERKKMGYRDNRPKFLLRSFDDKDREEAVSWIDAADVVIAGNADEAVLCSRKKYKKLILRYSERPLKKGFELAKYPYRWIKWHKMNPRKASIYLLCAGAYTSKDYSAFGLFKNKSIKWGYFPECVKYQSVTDLITQKDKKEIIWAGRFLDWKHPDDAVFLAKQLARTDIDFHITLIGTGEMEGELNRLLDSYHLKNKVSLPGAMTPEKVRENMEKAGIFLMTSDKKEGWGAVVNEAMNSGCAVVASREAGSVPYLINENINGLTYKTGDIESLTSKVKYLLEQPDEQRRLGNAAYQTILSEWNAETAAKRLLEVCEAILSEKDFGRLFESGPCSTA